MALSKVKFTEFVKRESREKVLSFAKNSLGMDISEDWDGQDSELVSMIWKRYLSMLSDEEKSELIQTEEDGEKDINRMKRKAQNSEEAIRRGRNVKDVKKDVRLSEKAKKEKEKRKNGETKRVEKKESSKVAEKSEDSKKIVKDGKWAFEPGLANDSEMRAMQKEIDFVFHLVKATDFEQKMKQILSTHDNDYYSIRKQIQVWLPEYLKSKASKMIAWFMKDPSRHVKKVDGIYFIEE